MKLLNMDFPCPAAVRDQRNGKIVVENRFCLIYGDERPLYQSLHPFITDSQTDSWCNSLSDNWVYFYDAAHCREC